jgi:tetratricopeptide (TPR) repeat protein
MTRLQRLLALLLGAAVVLLVPACTTPGPNHVEAVNTANKHWRDMRSGLILQMAQRQFDTGDLDQSEKNVGEALAVDPDNGRLYLLAGRITLERGQLERASCFFAKASSLDAKLHEARYYLGVVQQRWQQYDKALAAYQEAGKLAPDHVGYLLAEAEMLVTLDRRDEALKLLLDHMTYFDQNAGIRMAIGQLYAMQKQWGPAIDYLRQACLLKPDDLALQEELALTELAGGKAEPAVADLQRLLNQPGYAQRRDLQQALARGFVLAGRTADAKAIYVQLTRSEPSDVAAWQRLAELAWTMEDLNGAALAASRVAALTPKSHEGPLLLGLVCQKRGQIDEALRQFDRAAELAPAQTAPLILRGMVLEQAGRRAEAAQAYAQALKRQPDDAQARQLLARLTAEPK